MFNLWADPDVRFGLARPATSRLHRQLAAEDLCELFSRSKGLPCVVLRTSRFFSEADDKRIRST
jgi:hypothetical protein